MERGGGEPSGSWGRLLNVFPVGGEGEEGGILLSEALDVVPGWWRGVKRSTGVVNGFPLKVHGTACLT